MWVRGLEHAGSASSEWRAADELSQQAWPLGPPRAAVVAAAAFVVVVVAAVAVAVTVVVVEGGGKEEEGGGGGGRRREEEAPSSFPRPPPYHLSAESPGPGGEPQIGKGDVLFITKECDEADHRIWPNPVVGDVALPEGRGHEGEAPREGSPGQGRGGLGQEGASTAEEAREAVPRRRGVSQRGDGLCDGSHWRLPGCREYAVRGQCDTGCRLGDGGEHCGSPRPDGRRRSANLVARLRARSVSAAAGSWLLFVSGPPLIQSIG